MEIETGDYFVVTRGFKYGCINFNLFGTPRDEEPSYDRSYGGCVFLAREVCGPMVAAKCVYSEHDYKGELVGKTISLNTSEVEVMTVTAQYLEKMDIKAGNE